MNKFPLLGVNIDHVATIRQARGTTYPSIIEAALLAISGGADQITVHLREDRRHIQDRDVYDLKKVVSVPLNLEMAISKEIVDIAVDLRPSTATIVPEKREELTTEGGLDCIANRAELSLAVARLKKGGISVSLFIDPETSQVETAKELGAEVIELHTGRYCDSLNVDDKKNEFDKLRRSILLAKKLGLKVAAGHGLNYTNIDAVVKGIPEIEEYNIGHSIVARSIFVGLRSAVEEMAKLIRIS